MFLYYFLPGILGIQQEGTSNQPDLFNLRELLPFFFVVAIMIFTSFIGDEFDKHYAEKRGLDFRLILQELNYKYFTQRGFSVSSGRYGGYLEVKFNGAGGKSEAVGEVRNRNYDYPTE